MMFSMIMGGRQSSWLSSNGPEKGDDRFGLVLALDQPKLPPHQIEWIKIVYAKAYDELIQRLPLRDHGLTFYMTAIAGILGFAFSAKQHRTVALLLPYLTLGVSFIISQHDGVIGELSAWLAKLEARLTAEGYLPSEFKGPTESMRLPKPVSSGLFDFQKGLIAWIATHILLREIYVGHGSDRQQIVSYQEYLVLRCLAHMVILVVPAIIALAVSWDGTQPLGTFRVATDLLQSKVGLHDVKVDSKQWLWYGGLMSSAIVLLLLRWRYRERESAGY